MIFRRSTGLRNLITLKVLIRPKVINSGVTNKLLVITTFQTVVTIPTSTAWRSLWLQWSDFMPLKFDSDKLQACIIHTVYAIMSINVSNISILLLLSAFHHLINAPEDCTTQLLRKPRSKQMNIITYRIMTADRIPERNFITITFRNSVAGCRQRQNWIKYKNHQ